VLSLPVDAQCQDTVARGDFGKWMLKHIDRWFAFARGLGFGIDQMEELILVTGCDCTRSWANVAFLEGHMTQGQASFGVKVVQGSDVSINWRFSPENTEGAMVNWGPEGKVRLLANDFWNFETIFARPRTTEPTGGPMRIHSRVSCYPHARYITEAAKGGSRSRSTWEW
jgi:hypothetical protein